MIEGMCDWALELPLTYEKAGTTDNSVDHGVRLGLIQFSEDGKPLKAPPGTGTGGRFTGDMNELNADLDWHETHMIMKGTFVATAMDWAANMFATSPANRYKMLLIVTDDEVQDVAEAVKAQAK